MEEDRNIPTVAACPPAQASAHSRRAPLGTCWQSSRACNALARASSSAAAFSFLQLGLQNAAVTSVNPRARPQDSRPSPCATSGSPTHLISSLWRSVAACVAFSCSSHNMTGRSRAWARARSRGSTRGVDGGGRSSARVMVGGRVKEPAFRPGTTVPTGRWHAQMGIRCKRRSSGCVRLRSRHNTSSCVSSHDAIVTRNPCKRRSPTRYCRGRKVSRWPDTSKAAYDTYRALAGHVRAAAQDAIRARTRLPARRRGVSRRVALLLLGMRLVQLARGLCLCWCVGGQNSR
jgi:hypothetical protein